MTELSSWQTGVTRRGGGVFTNDTICKWSVSAVLSGRDGVQEEEASAPMG